MSQESSQNLSSQKLLEINDLHVQFATPTGVVHAVNGIDLYLRRQETLAIVGESGSGKSVSMLSILRLLFEPDAKIKNGSAMFASRDGVVDLLSASSQQLRKIRGREIGYVAQDPNSSLNPTATIGTQIGESIRTHLGFSKTESRIRSIDLLQRVGIADPHLRVDQYPHQFSGGMRQRIMIAVAISCNPLLLIADEPTTALDVTVQSQIVELVEDLRDELGLAVIWITHDLGVVAGIADRVAVMYAGRIVESADVHEFYATPRHPYSIGLIRAIPRIGQVSQRLDSIRGTPPEISTVENCCAFAPRCTYVLPRCHSELPQLEKVAASHNAACFVDVRLEARHE